MDFGQRLRMAREERDLTQDDIAKALGLTRPAIGRWENGRSKPRLDKLDQLAEVLGVTPRWLLQGDEDGPDGLTGDEEALLASFRAMSPENRRLTLRVADSLARYGTEAAPPPSAGLRIGLLMLSARLSGWLT